MVHHGDPSVHSSGRTLQSNIRGYSSFFLTLTTRTVTKYSRVTTNMTVIRGLKRVLFPLQDENCVSESKPSRKENVRVQGPRPLGQRSAASWNINAVPGGCLANLDAILAKPAQKTRRDKRHRDQENIKTKDPSCPDNGKDRPCRIPNTSPTAIMLATKARNFTMDSLAFLGEGTLRAPKPVSPLSTVSKQRRSKKSKAAKTKGTKSATAKIHKSTKTYLKDLTKKGSKIATQERTKGGKSNKRYARNIATAPPSGLGAMFGVTIVPIQKPTRAKAAPTSKPSVVQTNKGALGVVSPLPVPCVVEDETSNHPTTEIYQAIHSGKAKEKRRTKKQKGLKRPAKGKSAKVTKSIRANADAISSPASKNQSLRSERLTRRSKRQRQEIEEAKAETGSVQEGADILNAKVEVPMKCNQQAAGLLSPESDERVEEATTSQSGDTSLRRSKRRRSADFRYSPSAPAPAPSMRPTLNDASDLRANKEELTKDKYLANSTAISEDKPSRRSCRQIAAPDRFGAYVSNPDELRTPGWKNRKSGKVSTSKGKEDGKTVEAKVATQELFVADSMAEKKTSPELDASMWKTNELDMLRKSHQEANPKSTCFWDDVAARVGTRSADECRERWFSFAKTPVQAARKSKKTADAKHVSASKEDDIFNATPMRSLLDLKDIFGSEIDLNRAMGLTNSYLGSAIKTKDADLTESISSPHLNMATHGYKTYIKNVKRDVNKATKRKMPKLPKQRKNKKTISFKDGEGEVEIQGKLSPGGTLCVATDSVALGDTEDQENMYLSDDDEEDIEII